MAQRSSTVELTGALTIQNSGDIRDRLMAALAEGADVTVACAGATEVDLTFIQLLLSARVTALRTGRRFGLADPMPPVLQAVLERAGFDAADPQFLAHGGAQP